MVEEREAFIANIHSLDAAKLVFLDETWCNTKHHRDHGWAPLGEQPLLEAPRWGKGLTLLGAMSLSGPIAHSLFEGSYTGEHFKAWLRDVLFPSMTRGQTLLLDQPRLHKVAGVAELAEECGIILLYLPRYSPEFNPIELCWARLKRELRRLSRRKMDGLRDGIEEAWALLTRELCEACVRHCGYAISSPQVAT